MKNYVIPTVVAIAAVTIFTKVLFTTSEKQAKQRTIRKTAERRKTKELLEKHARSEIDFLSKKYDIEILQDQLDKKKADIKQTNTGPSD